MRTQTYRLITLTPLSTLLGEEAQPIQMKLPGLYLVEVASSPEGKAEWGWGDGGDEPRHDRTKKRGRSPVSQLEGVGGLFWAKAWS